MAGCNGARRLVSQVFKTAKCEFVVYRNTVKTKLSRLSEQYLAALRQYIKPGAKANLESATRLGHQAVALRLETLGLARIHEQALRSLVAPGHSAKSHAARIQRARAFFAQAVAPIEKTHHAALKADIHLKQLNQTLSQRAVESSASARHLKRSILQRQSAEAALRKSGKQRTKLLEESRRLQQHSRHLTREILSAQEDEWQKISHQLHDEIAQILLGINVRLLTLKKAAKANTGSLRKEIASTQRLVKQSVKTINRFAHEFGLQHET
jgi:two-component system, NarL family, sensor histidine kinase DegS